MAGPVPCIGRGESLFVDAAPALKLHRISEIFIAHIDCDIYGFSVDALASIRDRLQLGCVLMFDDYNAYCADNKRGERRALREFCETVPFEFEPWFAYQYGGQAFLCVEES
jgi:hypothetical protein